jgi:hypothetical protein
MQAFHKIRKGLDTRADKLRLQLSHEKKDTNSESPLIISILMATWGISKFMIILDQFQVLEFDIRVALG